MMAVTTTADKADIVLTAWKEKVLYSDGFVLILPSVDMTACFPVLQALPACLGGIGHHFYFRNLRLVLQM